jgi:hypothetical protein
MSQHQHFNESSREGWLPTVIFWIALALVVGICASLNGHWWHFVIGVLAVFLVRITSRFGHL